MQKYVRQLDGAVALDTEMREQANDLTKAVAQRFGEMDLVIRLRGRNKADAADFVVSSNVGLDEMQRTRALGAQLIESASEQVVDNRVEIFPPAQRHPLWAGRWRPWRRCWASCCTRSRRARCSATTRNTTDHWRPSAMRWNLRCRSAHAG